jgi:Arc/MetJ-type ribon-helix-helix transcriptional regulator
MHITSEIDGITRVQEFICTGFIARGYRRSQCEAIKSALRLLLRDEHARDLLADPEQFFLTLARMDLNYTL